MPYLQARSCKPTRDYRRTRVRFSRKCLMNVAGAGKFSSDRTIAQYAKRSGTYKISAREGASL